MNYEDLKEWGKKEFKCTCGFVGQNKMKKKHQSSDLHRILSRFGYKNIHGKSKIKCENCAKEITVCGFPAHYYKCY